MSAVLNAPWINRQAADLLAQRGATSVLATSREALGVEGEQLFRLEPLRSDTADSPAVQLFLDRARAVDARCHVVAAFQGNVALTSASG